MERNNSFVPTRRGGSKLRDTGAYLFLSAAAVLDFITPCGIQNLVFVLSAALCVNLVTAEEARVSGAWLTLLTLCRSASEALGLGIYNIYIQDASTLAVSSVVSI